MHRSQRPGRHLVIFTKFTRKSKLRNRLNTMPAPGCPSLCKTPSHSSQPTNNSLNNSTLFPQTTTGARTMFFFPRLLLQSTAQRSQPHTASQPQIQRLSMEDKTFPCRASSLQGKSAGSWLRRDKNKLSCKRDWISSWQRHIRVLSNQMSMLVTHKTILSRQTSTSDNLTIALLPQVSILSSTKVVL